MNELAINLLYLLAGAFVTLFVELIACIVYAFRFVGGKK